MQQKGKVRAEEKVEIVRMYESGEVSLHQAAEHAGVGETSIRGWTARYKAEGAAGFLPYDQNRIYPRELKLRAVREYLSGAGSLSEISIKYKFHDIFVVHFSSPDVSLPHLVHFRYFYFLTW